MRRLKKKFLAPASPLPYKVIIFNLFDTICIKIVKSFLYDGGVNTPLIRYHMIISQIADIHFKGGHGLDCDADESGFETFSNKNIKISKKNM